MDNQTAYEQKARVGMALELQRISDELVAAKAELAEAEASIAHLRHCARLQDSATAAVMERAEKAEAELAALREDATRYRWLREQNEVDKEGYKFYVGISVPITEADDDLFPTASDLDAAIDAARKEGA
jgi:DNA repair ATPase RecN